MFCPFIQDQVNIVELTFSKGIQKVISDSDNYEADLGSVLRVAANAKFIFVQMTGVYNIQEYAEKYAINTVNNDDIIRIPA